MEDGAYNYVKQYGDSKGDEELSEAEADVVVQVAKLAMQQDEETEDQNKDSGEDSDIDAEGGSDNGNESDYIPSKIQGSHGSARVSRKHALLEHQAPLRHSSANRGPRTTTKVASKRKRT